MRRTLAIVLNGTGENPYHRMGLTQNPFPQMGRMETDAACLALQSLGGDPIPDTDYIRAKLKGHFSEEVIALCCREFRPGEMVSFGVYWDADGD